MNEMRRWRLVVAFCVKLVDGGSTPVQFGCGRAIVDSFFLLLKVDDDFYVIRLNKTIPLLSATLTLEGV